MHFCGNCGTRLVEPALQLNIDTTPRPETLGAMVGADLLERFRRAGLDVAGQRRNVTVLFADLTGYTELASHMDNEDLYELVQKYISLLANDIYKYEGMVDKFTGDGLMALFGAPIAHENDAELAVRAALDMLADVAKLSLEMRERLGSTELRVHIGLHAGSVIVGGIGSDMLMNYTAIGDTVNLAQRLDAVADPGMILVSEAVYQITKALFDYEPIPNLLLKGILHPVTGYRLLQPKPKPGPVRGIEGLRALMVGRESELRSLTQVVGALITYQQGAFAMIVGEAGVGKSRLLSELRALSSQLPVTILAGYSLTYRRTVSYWLFLELLHNYLKVTPDMPVAQISERLEQKVTQVVGDQAAGILPYLRHLLSLPLRDASIAERISYLDAGQLRQQIFLAVRELLVAEARNLPLILLLEDMHWADEASLDLLSFLLDSTRQAPLFILAVTRPFQDGPLNRIVRQAEKSLVDNFVLIQLKTLSLQQSEQLLDRLLDIPNLPLALREQIIQRASGIPLYLEEILRMLIDSGTLQRENNHWMLADGTDVATLGVPDTLQGLILTRFDRLNPTLRRILQVATVVGRQFNITVIGAVLNTLSQAEIQEFLTRLIEREFILPPPDLNAVDYSFKHILVSDTIYGTLLKRESSELHGLVGEAIEKIYANRLDEQIDLLARHFSWSPKKDKAFYYLTLAGLKATRSYINDQAREYFTDALALLPQVSHTPHQALQVHMGLGDLLLLTGEYQVARDQYLVCNEVLVSEEPSQYITERSTLERKIGTTFERQGDFEQALICLARAQQILAESPTSKPVENAEILNDIGWIHFRRGALDEAEKSLNEAMNLTKGAPRYDVIATIYNRLGGVYFKKGQLAQASTYVRKSLVFREEIGDIVGTARSYNNLGLISWNKGDWTRALEDFSHSLELNITLGDVEGLANLHSNIGLLQTDRGNPEEAKYHLEKALEDAQKIGHSFLEGLAYLHLSRYWLTAKEWQKSLECSQQSLATFQSMNSVENLGDLYVNMGEAWLGFNDVDQANKYAQSALQVLRERDGDPLPPTLEKGSVLRLLGNVERMLGNAGQASQMLKESMAIFTTLGNQLELGRTLVAMALLSLASKDKVGYRIHLAEARLIFRQLGALVDLRQVEQHES
jgi:predicted ATPase/class 3 adenylate cyclase